MSQTFICKHCRGEVLIESTGRLSQDMTIHCAECSHRLTAYEGIIAAMQKVVTEFTPPSVVIQK